MRNLLQFISKHHALLLFLLLELTALLLLIQNNHFRKAAFLNSTSGISAQVYESRHELKSYLSLKEINKELALENEKLKTLLSQEPVMDSSYMNHQFIYAEVINNSTSKRNNYLTLNRGKRHGVKKGMGVITPQGIIGIVKETSNRFSSVLSVLHSQSKVSVILKKNHYFGSLEWPGHSYREALVKDIPSHVEVNIGDTIISSGYSTIFPSATPIGLVQEINTKPNSKFHELDITFIEDFKQLKLVYICKSNFQEEKSNLEASNND
jgi:rod shape-determining protein MreC